MGKRIGAYLIDIVIAWAVYAVLFLALSDSVETGFDPCGEPGSPTLCFHAGDTTWFADGGDATAIILLPVLYWFLINVVMQGLTGSTPGKAIFGLKTVRRDTGQICGMGKAFVRSILWVVDAFPYCFPLVGLITGLSTDGHKRVGDMAAGTAVVDKNDVGVPLDGGAPAYDPGQQWAAPAGAGFPPPPGGAAAPPPPGGYAPPPGGFASPPPPAGDFGAPPAADPSPAPPLGDFGAPSAPEPMPAPEPMAAPEPMPAPEPDSPSAEPPTVAVAPAEPAMVESDQPPTTSEPQWDPARNTYIQWDPVLAAWMQWDDPGQRWKPIDT